MSVVAEKESGFAPAHRFEARLDRWRTRLIAPTYIAVAVIFTLAFALSWGRPSFGAVLYITVAPFLILSAVHYFVTMTLGMLGEMRQ